MPTYTSRERVRVVMRYLYNHPDSKHTYQSLGRDLDIPGTSIRRTVTFDYPKCFVRRWSDNGLALPEPIVWPDDDEFELYESYNEIAPDDLSDQLTIEQERENWAKEKQQLYDIIENLTKAPVKASRTTAPKDSFVTKYPSEKYFNVGNMMIGEYPDLAKALGEVIANPKVDKTYFKMWNMALTMLITLKAVRTDHPELSIKEWIK